MVALFGAAPVARRLGGAVVAAMLALAPAVARADYLLAPGDTLEIAVAGVAELRQRATIDIDGRVQFPLIAPVEAAGHPLSDVLADVRRDMPSKAFRQRTLDGRENLIVIDPNDISLNIADYRALYVRGDVAKPGEQNYRPGMTVRQAIALAGGYDIMRFRMDNPFLQSSDLRADYQSLWTEFARQKARSALIEAQLSGKDPQDLTKAIQVPIAPDMLALIIKSEIDRVNAEKSGAADEDSYLQRLLKYSQSQLETLTNQRQQAEEAQNDQSERLNRQRQLLDKGLSSQNRVTDEQRTYVMAASRLLETLTQLADRQKAHEDLGRQIQRTDADRRLALMKELQDINIRMSDIQGRLQASAEKMLYTGAVRSQLLLGRNTKPKVTVYRSGKTGSQEIGVTEDSPVMPGDVVEVSLDAQLTPEALSR